MKKVSPLAAALLREELRIYLTELAADDIGRIWQQERLEGLSSGIDQVFHFFFDDHDFNESDIGIVFFNEAEVTAVGALKAALEAVLNAVGDKGDDDFISHSLWPKVAMAAREAEALLNDGP